MRKLMVVLFALLLFFIGAGLRIWNLTESPGYEEISASLAAMRSPGDYLRNEQIALCPPVFYFMIRLLALIGGQLGSMGHLGLMRIPSVFFGALTPVILYIAARRLFNERAAILGSFFLAVNPLHIFFSQEVQPAALFIAVSVIAFYYFVRSGETNKARHWAFFDVASILLLHIHSEGLFVLGSFLLLHLLKVLFFRNPEEQRRVRKLRLLATVLFNYLIILSVALPWLSLMPTLMPWYEDRPTFQDLALVFGHYFVFGMLGHMPTTLYLAVAILFLMLIPPLLKYFRKPDTHFTMAAGVMLLVILLPFGYSYIGRIRFGSVRTGVLVTPFACLVIGILLARCNFYVRAIIFGLFTSILLFATTRQSITEQKIPYNYIAKVVRENAKPGSLVVFWPDYTQNIGEYYFGKDYESISATQFFKNMGDPPIHQNVAFVVSQMPSREPYLYTFKGALKQYSNAQVLWQDKLNMVMQARDFDMLQLRLWYSDPYDLHIFDKAVKDVTQFIFTPADPIFRTRDFEYRDPELCFDSTGRRSAWTKTRNTDIDLTVTLAPGNYILKLHCSPDLNLPAYNMKFNRQVTLDFRTGEKVKHIQLDKEMTVQVPFDADVEQHILPVHIETGPLLKLNYPRRMELGIRIYSISIDLAAPAGGT